MSGKKIIYVLGNLLCLLLVPALSVEAQRSLTLEECSQLALENNARMKNARLDVKVRKRCVKRLSRNIFHL